MSFKNEKDELYYGVETNSNKSKGKDAIIIGTPHLQPCTCKMFARVSQRFCYFKHRLVLVEI